MFNVGERVQIKTWSELTKTSLNPEFFAEFGGKMAKVVNVIYSNGFSIEVDGLIKSVSGDSLKKVSNEAEVPTNLLRL